MLGEPNEEQVEDVVEEEEDDRTCWMGLDRCTRRLLRSMMAELLDSAPKRKRRRGSAKKGPKGKVGRLADE